MGSWLIAVYMVVDGVCEDDQFIVICFMTCEFHSVLTAFLVSVWKIDVDATGRDSQ